MDTIINSEEYEKFCNIVYYINHIKEYLDDSKYLTELCASAEQYSSMLIELAIYKFTNDINKKYKVDKDILKRFIDDVTP